MTIYYTYLIGWTSLNKYYYGVRYAKKCNPKDLWKTYFTSSKYVKEMRTIYGDPDLIQIRKTFNDKDKAIFWENKVLSKLKVIENDKWINKTTNKAISQENALLGCSKTKSVKMREKLSKSLTGRKLSEETKNRISESRKNKPSNFKGKQHSEKTKIKLSERGKLLIGEKNPFYGKEHSEDSKMRISESKKARDT
jgi:hypothetical protein